MKAKNWIKISLIIETQIVLILVIILILKTNELDDKIFNTNKFIYEALINKRVESLNTVKDNDIIIGEADACVTMFVYSRFDCPACHDFFIDNYELLKKDYIDKGILKLVIRNLVHSSKQNTLYATKCAHYTNQIGLFDSYNQEVNKLYPNLDSTMLRNIVLKLDPDKVAFNSFMSNKNIERELLKFAFEIRNAKINSTPTLYINDQFIIGNSRYERIQKLIQSQLKNTLCEY